MSTTRTAYDEGREQAEYIAWKAQSCQQKDCGESEAKPCAACWERFCDLHLYDVDGDLLCGDCFTREANLEDAADLLIAAQGRK